MCLLYNKAVNVRICVILYVFYTSIKWQIKKSLFVDRKWLILTAACLQNPIHVYCARDFKKEQTHKPIFSPSNGFFTVFKLSKRAFYFILFFFQVDSEWISGPNQAPFCTWSIFGWAKFWLWSHREINKVIFKPPRSGAEESRDTMSAGYLGIFPQITQWVSGGGPCDALSKDYHFPTIAPSTGSTNKHSPLGIEENEPRKHHWSFSV